MIIESQKSGDLDMGAGEFFPMHKYMNKGWQNLLRFNLVILINLKTQKARELEKAKVGW